jgi:hypothetical protein
VIFESSTFLVFEDYGVFVFDEVLVLHEVIFTIDYRKGRSIILSKEDNHAKQLIVLTSLPSTHTSRTPIITIVIPNLISKRYESTTLNSSEITITMAQTYTSIKSSTFTSSLEES